MALHTTDAFGSKRDFDVDNGIRVTDTTRPYKPYPKWRYMIDGSSVLCAAEADVPADSYEHADEAAAAKAEADAKAKPKA